MKIKICGITNIQDALCAKDAGADFIGFIFYNKSPRYVAPEIASQISKQLDGVQKVGVFVNEDPDVIKKICDDVGLDFIQLHGDEDIEYLSNFDKDSIIKVLRVKDDIECFDGFLNCGLKYILLDTYHDDSYGGTGQTFTWDLALQIKEKFDGKIFLSGGINIDNIGEVIKKINPFCVDVSSGVEIEPGKKDHDKVREIVGLVSGLPG